MAQRTGTAHPVGETNWGLLMIAGSAVIVAFVLFWASNHDAWYGENSALQATLNQVGGLVLATGLIALGWELLGKRRFAAEILSKARLSSEVIDAGITRITDQYLEDVEWNDLLEGVTKLDVVVAYARTWRNTHAHRLRRIAERPGTRIRVFLPDPDDEETMSVLARRFNTTPGELRPTVREAVSDFSGLAVPGGGTVRVYVRAGDAVFSCYRFDGRAVLTLYSHARDRRTSVPTFGVRGGKLFQFVYEELTAIRQQSRLVFPPQEDGPTND